MRKQRLVQNKLCAILVRAFAYSPRDAKFSALPSRLYLFVLYKAPLILFLHHTLAFHLAVSNHHDSFKPKENKKKMGQSFNKFTSGNGGEGKKEKILKGCYGTHFKDKQSCSQSEFYRAICDTVEELNKEMGYTQVKAIEEDILKAKYKKYCADRGKGKPTEQDFEEIMEDLQKNLELTGLGAKDTLLYIFGVPASATLIKNALMPTLVSNEVLIPSMTSLTALVLAKLNKI